MKKLVSLALAAMLVAPAMFATPALAQTMEECLANHSKSYCEAALGTGSIGGGHDDESIPCLVICVI